MKKSFFGRSGSETKGKFLQFLSRKGFYIVLFVCVVIIGVTAVLVTKTNLNFYAHNGVLDEQPVVDQNPAEESADAQSPPEETVSSSVAPSTKDGNAAKDTQNVPTTTSSPAKLENGSGQASKAQAGDVKSVVVKKSSQPTKNSKPASSAKAKPTEQPKPTAQPNVIKKLAYPLSGQIILEYAKDKMIFSKTMQDWRTHDGIDIKADIGTQVKAAADGIVEKAYQDSQLGFTVIIDHGNGLKTKYSNLSSANMVKEQQKIKLGDILGGVGNTAPSEIGEEPHLHFEVIKDGSCVNPMEYLPN